MSLEDTLAQEVGRGFVESLSRAPLRFSVSSTGEPRVLVLQGELDMATASELQEAALAVIQGLECDLVLEIEGQSFVDSKPGTCHLQGSIPGLRVPGHGVATLSGPVASERTDFPA